MYGASYKGGRPRDAKGRFMKRPTTRRSSGMKLTRAPRSNVYLSGVYSFKRKTDTCFDFNLNSYSVAAITTPPNSTNIHLIGFAFECLPNDSEYRALFKYYKITGVKVNIVQGQNISDIGGSGVPNNLPTVFTCFAPDDSVATIPTTLQQVRERQSTRTHYPGMRRVIKHYVANPRIAEEVGDMSGSGNILVASGYRDWLPTDNTKLVHNGLIIAVDNLLNNTEMTHKLEFTYYFKCKQVV